MNINDLAITNEDLKSIGVSNYDLRVIKEFILKEVNNNVIPDDMKSELALAKLFLEKYR